MKSSIVPVGVIVAALLPTLAEAQTQGKDAKPAAPSLGSRLFGRNKAQAQTPAQAQAADAQAAQVDKSALKDAKVLPAGAALPAPVMADDSAVAPPPVPPEVLEPYRLTKDAGPFMVMAHTFRGPRATHFAMALCQELRQEFGLPAWIFIPKEQPMHSLIRNVPPTAPDYVGKADVSLPEKARLYDEAAVLVGNCKTLDESEALLHKVKKLHPKCMKDAPEMWEFRKGKGLSRALRTTNPYIPVQDLFPRKGDPLIMQMNSGPWSVFNCPGRYTLQVAEFVGRSSFNPNDKHFGSLSSLRNSPLMSAGDNAQKVAEALAKDPEVVKTGYKPYVYHDRTSSKVLLGSFDNPNDPAALQLRQSLMQVKLQERVSKRADFMLVPADKLTDLKELPR